MRLDKYLADMRVGTRSDLKKAIRKGTVTVDGAVVRDPGFSLSGNETVMYGDRLIHYETEEYYMMNKPAGVISASEDRRQKTVLDLLDGERRKDLFPVGRLDKDTVGLLLITNDGEMAHRLLAPKHHVDKVYYARVSGCVTEEDVRAFAGGLRFDETLVAEPAGLVILQADDEVSEVKVTIHEGKFHQIKKMFLAVGREVLYLKRLSMGPLVLDETLSEGESRRLTDAELAELKRAAGMQN